MLGQSQSLPGCPKCRGVDATHWQQILAGGHWGSGLPYRLLDATHQQAAHLTSHATVTGT